MGNSSYPLQALRKRFLVPLHLADMDELNQGSIQAQLGSAKLSSPLPKCSLIALTVISTQDADLGLAIRKRLSFLLHLNSKAS